MIDPALLAASRPGLMVRYGRMIVLVARELKRRDPQLDKSQSRAMARYLLIRRAHLRFSTALKRFYI